MTAVDLQALIEAGHQPCPCGAVSRPSRTACYMCGAPFPGAQSTGRDDSPTRGRAQHRGSTPARRATSPRRRPPLNPQLRHSRSSVGSLAGRAVELVVHGIPRPEGSTRAIAAGVVAADDPNLREWREAITAEARRVAGDDWVAPNTAVAVAAVFTVPRPVTAPAGTPVHADGHRDLDKLVRAIDDALCPSLPDKGPGPFRLIGSDMRVSQFPTLAKTHPRPLHTHPMALAEPGVWIRLTLVPPVTSPPEGRPPVSGVYPTLVKESS